CPPGVPLLARLVLVQVARLAQRDDHQELPQVVAVVELGEAALLRPAAEAVEGAERHVLLVGDGAAGGPQALPGQAHELREIALPEPLRAGLGAGLQLRDPERDGSRHDAPPPEERAGPPWPPWIHSTAGGRRRGRGRLRRRRRSGTAPRSSAGGAGRGTPPS